MFARCLLRSYLCVSCLASSFAQRSLNHQNIATSISNGVWATQPHNEKKLADAFDSGEEARHLLLVFALLALTAVWVLRRWC